MNSAEKREREGLLGALHARTTLLYLQSQFKGHVEQSRMPRAVLWCSKSKRILSQFEEMRGAVDMSLCRFQHRAQPQTLSCSNVTTRVLINAVNVFFFWFLLPYDVYLYIRSARDDIYILVIANIRLHRIKIICFFVLLLSTGNGLRLCRGLSYCLCILGQFSQSDQCTCAIWRMKV
jgi:hypothetical protein